MNFHQSNSNLKELNDRKWDFLCHLGICIWEINFREHLTYQFDTFWCSDESWFWRIFVTSWSWNIYQYQNTGSPDLTLIYHKIWIAENSKFLKLLVLNFFSLLQVCIYFYNTLYTSTEKNQGEQSRRVPITRYLVNCQVFTTKPAFILKARQFYVQRRESQEMGFNGCKSYYYFY